MRSRSKPLMVLSIVNLLKVKVNAGVCDVRWIAFLCFWLVLPLKICNQILSALLTGIVIVRTLYLGVLHHSVLLSSERLRLGRRLAFRLCHTRRRYRHTDSSQGCTRTSDRCTWWLCRTSESLGSNHTRQSRVPSSGIRSSTYRHVQGLTSKPCEQT